MNVPVLGRRQPQDTPFYDYALCRLGEGSILQSLGDML